MKQNLLDLNYEDLKSFLSEKIKIEEKKLNMRTQQIFTAVYQKGLNDRNAWENRRHKTDVFYFATQV